MSHDQEEVSIGRQVHYRAPSSGNWLELTTEICRSAVITELGADAARVDLCVFNPSGLFFSKSRHDPKLEAGTWHWYWECEDDSTP